jgi:hypothetical protein
MTSSQDLAAPVSSFVNIIHVGLSLAATYAASFRSSENFQYPVKPGTLYQRACIADIQFLGKFLSPGLGEMARYLKCAFRNRAVKSCSEDFTWPDRAW